LPENSGNATAASDGFTQQLNAGRCHCQLMEIHPYVRSLYTAEYCR